MKHDLKVAEALLEVKTEIDGVIRVLEQSYPLGNKTKVTYQDGSVVEYSIKGILDSNSIPNKNNAVKIEIADAVTSIGDGALSGCSNLESVTIPTSISSISNYAFTDCTSLTGVWNTESSITSIGNYAFSGCSSMSTGASYLTAFSVPPNVTIIGEGAFFNCTSISVLELVERLSEIGKYAFYGCNHLENELYIPNSVNNIGYLALYDTNISVTHVGERTMSYVQSMDNYPWGLTQGGYIDCSDGTLTVPGGSGSGASG